MPIIAPVLNVSNIPGLGRGRSARKGAGRFEAPPTPNPIGWMCTCECDEGCVIAPADLPDGVSECFPYYEKQP